VIAVADGNIDKVLAALGRAWDCLPEAGPR